jgi:beta-N-acetylhexosaminidase
MPFCLGVGETFKKGVGNMNKALNWTATLGLTTALLVSSVPMATAVVAEETPATSIEQRVDAKLASMTLEQKLGQMIMPDFRLWNGANHTALATDVARVVDRFDLGGVILFACLLYTSPSPRDRQKSRMPSSA